MPLKLFHTMTFCLLLIAFAANGDVRQDNQPKKPLEKPNGILLEVKEKSVLGSKNLQALVKSEGLIDGKFYPSQSILFYRLAPNREKTTEQLKTLCDTIMKKFSLVTICEVNLLLRPNQVAPSINQENPASCVAPNSSNSILKEYKPYLDHYSHAKCDLFPVKDDQHDYQKTIVEEGLSPFWAQEYVGSDLLKEEMEQRKVDTAPTAYKLAIWDGSRNQHGEKVSNLIAGPYASSLVHRPKTISYADTFNTEDYFKHYENLENQYQKSNRYPRFINNSMEWRKSELIEKTVQKLSEKNVIFITAAGNLQRDTKDEDPTKASSSRAGHSIVVASHAPNGLSSSFTNFGQDVDITAPSDSHILSFTNDGSPSKFGGTSGASPLVTAALLSFELISGVELSTIQFKALLKQTAIRHRHDPPRQYTGAGYLNTYKIGAIAFRLAKLCAKSKSKTKKKACALEALKQDQTYDFSDLIQKNITNDFNQSFPECSEGKSTVNNKKSTCEEKKGALKEIRKAAFLDPQNGVYWKKIACVSQSSGFSLDAKYYERLASGRRLVVDKSLLKQIAVADMVELGLENDKEVVLTALKREGGALEYASEQLKNDKEVVLTALKTDELALKHASEQLKNDKEFVLAILKTNGWAFEYASDQLKSDKDVVLVALKSNGRALEFASEQLKNDKEVVLAALKSNGGALKFASDRLKNDKGFVLAAVKTSGYALKFASDQLKNDKEVVLVAVKTNGYALRFASDQLKNDKEAVLAALETNAEAFEYASDQLKNDKEFVRQVNELAQAKHNK